MNLQNATAAPGVKARDGGRDEKYHGLSEHSAAQPARQCLANGVAIYDGRHCMGGFVEAPGGFIVLDGNGLVIGAVGTRAEARQAIWQARGGGSP